MKEEVELLKEIPKDEAEEEDADLKPNPGKIFEETAFLSKYPNAEEIFSQIENMILDYRNTNREAMSQDNAEFQATTSKILESFPVSETQAMYRRYQDKWLKYVLGNNIKTWELQNQQKLDAHLTSFFIKLAESYAPSTLYVIFSCVNSWFITHHNKKINDLLALNRFLKANTSTYVCRKSAVFTAEQVDQLLKFCQDSNDPSHTLLGVGVALLYYGLLRICEVTKIKEEDVSHD